MNYLLRTGCIWKFCSCNHVLCLMITALNRNHYRSLCLCQSLLTGQRRWWWACSGGVQSLHRTSSASSSTVHNIGWPCPGSRPILMSRRLEIVVVLLGPGDPVIIFYVTAVTGAGWGLEHVSCVIWSGAMLVSWLLSLCHGTESQVFTAPHTLYWILLHNNITITITILGWYIVDTWQLQDSAVWPSLSLRYYACLILRWWQTGDFLRIFRDKRGKRACDRISQSWVTTQGYEW